MKFEHVDEGFVKLVVYRMRCSHVLLLRLPVLSVPSRILTSANLPK